MAGSVKGMDFREVISPFLREKMDVVKKEKGEHSEDYQALYWQYIKTPKEQEDMLESNQRHWEADMKVSVSEESVQDHGFERLYDRTVVIEPTMACAAHCRYCLRANYDIFTLKENEIVDIAKYCGSEKTKSHLREVLITGGDPFVIPKRVNLLVQSLIEHAPNIKVVRIGTRLPLHDPGRCDNDLMNIFRNNSDKVRFEVATQINHVADLFPESIDVYKQMQELGVTIYSQNVILKQVNDNEEALINLYNKLRDLAIEPHYLFHCVPMKGMHHFRTTVERGLELAKKLTNSGRVSGRAKPMYAVMTDIGKITLYDGTIVKKDEEKNRVLLQSTYSFEERMKNNPSWKLPPNAEKDNQGNLRVWYLDGED